MQFKMASVTMNALLLTIATFTVAASGESEPVPATANCISSTIHLINTYKTTVVWSVKNGWSELLNFSPAEKDKVDFTLPVSDPAFPVNGSIRIVFGRPRSGALSLFGKFRSVKKLSYSMDVYPIVGKTTLTPVMPSKSWTFTEFERDFYKRFNEPEFRASFYPSDPVYGAVNKTERERLIAMYEQARRTAEASVYVGYIPALHYEDLQGALKKEQTGSAIPELTIVFQISAKEIMSSSNGTPSDCSSVPGYKTFLETRKAVTFNATNTDGYSY